MDGRQCLSEILQINPDAKVVMASGYSEAGLASGSTVGAKEYIQKPYEMRQLLTTVRHMLDAD